MSRRTFEQLRLPLALVLVLVAALVLFPRDGADPAADSTPDQTASVVAGEPAGEVLPTEPTLGSSPPADTSTPSPSPDAEETAEPDPTDAPADDGFTAEILICRSNSGPTCNGEMRDVPPSVNRFTALVLFTDINAGDELRAVLEGSGGTRDGGSYTFESGGDGHYFTTFSTQDLEPGDYTITALRNGDEVATTSFRRLGN